MPAQLQQLARCILTIGTPAGTRLSTSILQRESSPIGLRKIRYWRKRGIDTEGATFATFEGVTLLRILRRRELA